MVRFFPLESTNHASLPESVVCATATPNLARTKRSVTPCSGRTIPDLSPTRAASPSPQTSRAESER